VRAELPILREDLTSLTPWIVRATWIARSASAFDFTSPDSVTTPPAVFTSILRVPISGSLSSAAPRSPFLMQRSAFRDARRARRAVPAGIELRRLQATCP
jgi:hypothetical protein